MNVLTEYSVTVQRVVVEFGQEEEQQEEKEEQQEEEKEQKEQKRNTRVGAGDT